MIPKNTYESYSGIAQNINKKWKEFSNEQKDGITQILGPIFSENIITVEKQVEVEVVKRHYFQQEKIHKYDIIYTNESGVGKIPHYHIVFKVDKEYAYALLITSEKEHFAPFLIEKSRMFKGSYITNIIGKIPIEIAKAKFVFTFDSKKEFDEILKKVKENYLKIIL